MWETLLKSTEDLNWIFPGTILQLTSPANVSLMVTAITPDNANKLVITGDNISSGSPHKLVLRVPKYSSKTSPTEATEYVSITGSDDTLVGQVSLRDFKRLSSFGKIIFPDRTVKPNQTPIMVPSDMLKIEPNRHLILNSANDNWTLMILNRTPISTTSHKIHGQVTQPNILGESGTTHDLILNQIQNGFEVETPNKKYKFDNVSISEQSSRKITDRKQLQ